ncbi:MAG: mechanosensitive ion channel, partial [Desulfocapsaceae bacterium]|nr:mechanosensitive ion channel [Desulfocapsaceae bacterium]
PNFLTAQLLLLWQWLSEAVLNVSTLIEVSIIVIGILLAYGLSRPMRKRLENFLRKQPWYERTAGRIIGALLPLIGVILAIIFLRISTIAVARFELSVFLIDTAIRLLTAWLIIKFTTSLLKDSNWARLLSIAAWTIAALHILNLLIPAINLLDQLAIDLGGVRISLLLLIKGVIVFAVLIKLASSGSSLLEKRIQSFDELTPSVQVLLSKALKITLLAIAVIVALGSLGINLSAFAFIGGAIGVGVGFGLQKVVSNLVSGIILLLDRSIKPGDVIEIDETYGRIQSLGARYVSVATRDRTEYLIPNEDLITNQVINWSFSDTEVRLKIVVGVSYDSDVHEVMRLMVEAAQGIPRVLETPKPVCQLKNFGDNSIDMELRIWISDPANGVSNVSSAVRVAIWDTFKENNIEIPFPQRDVHIKSGQQL